MYGIPLPPGIDGEESREIQRLKQWTISNTFKPLAIGQFGSHELLRTIAQYLQDAAQEKTELKYVLFSAHDSTLMSLMSAFQNPLSAIPPYASDVRILLFRLSQPDSYSVAITFNDTKVRIPSCKEEDCSLKEFIAFVEK